MNNTPRLIEVAFPFKQASLDLACERFDKTGDVCYKINTSPLLLREQGARRPIAASAFFVAARGRYLIQLQGKR